MGEIFKGRISWFGGPDDRGMKRTEGLTFFEHWEADHRPDLFLPRCSDPVVGTSQRLRQDAYYCALPIEGKSHLFGDFDRQKFKATRWRITNPANNWSVVCTLVDDGPGDDTGRLVDVSRRVLRDLGATTDDIVEVEQVS